MNNNRLSGASPGFQARLLTCSADVVEDAEQQGFGNPAGPPDRTVQFVQGPVEFLRLLGLDGDTRLVLLHRGHSVVPNAAQSPRPRPTVDEHKDVSSHRSKVMEGHGDAEEGQWLSGRTELGGGNTNLLSRTETLTESKFQKNSQLQDNKL